MKLNEIKTLREVAIETGISYRTLTDRLKLVSFNLTENVDYKKLGKGQSIILSPKGIEKIIKK